MEPTIINPSTVGWAPTIMLSLIYVIIELIKFIKAKKSNGNGYKTTSRSVLTDDEHTKFIQTHDDASEIKKMTRDIWIQTKDSPKINDAWLNISKSQIEVSSNMARVAEILKDIKEELKNIKLKN